ncbi:hypothetical protein [Jiangella endophytica]|uniref:hypothetical protein n=1 Tax=Jiangella endophytica TaxID=1623398 RepID=UPI000E3458EC|nr:hypothetical protein [Jiangella endophytica]
MAHLSVRRRRAVAPAVLALVAMLATAACGDETDGGEIASAAGDDHTGSTATAPPDEPTEPDDQGLAFAACMRDQGIDLPDPTGEGGLRDAFQGIVGSYDAEAIQAAMEACEDQLPTQLAEQRDQAMDEDTQLALAECLREQGVDVPDDLFEGGLPEGVDREDLTAAMDECRDVTGGEQ